MAHSCKSATTIDCTPTKSPTYVSMTLTHDAHVMPCTRNTAFSNTTGGALLLLAFVATSSTTVFRVVVVVAVLAIDDESKVIMCDAGESSTSATVGSDIFFFNSTLSQVKIFEKTKKKKKNKINDTDVIQATLCTL